MTEADLIEELRSHPLLWDPRNKDYQRELIWSLIQTKFGPAKAELHSFFISIMSVSRKKLTSLRQAHSKAIQHQK
ncbi:hypothetical protein SNE40_016776 [Patella caerulea]|uniref:MADF domain-containing protein n=1 Tax=Patella caerulea TaxID=87958 RepID=A0AAN8JFD1_PATCE